MADTSTTMNTSESQDGAPAGTIFWVVDKISELDEYSRVSPSLEVHGTKWQAAVYKRNQDESDFLAVHLYGMENDSLMWSINVSATFSVFDKDNVPFEREFKKQRYDCTQKVWGYRNFMTWERLMDGKEGFVRNDKITIQVRFSLNDIVGFRRIPRFDFTDANNSVHDVTLVMNGQKLHVSKQYLSIHSPVFHAMLYGEFVEKNKEEIELKDVDYNSFTEMLHVIYPSGKKITDDNAVRLLVVGDRFQINMVIDQVEQFLINSSNLSLAAKLKLSGDYRLVGLQGFCLDSLKTTTDVTDLKNTEEYRLFTDETKLALLEKLMKLLTV